MNGDYKDYQDFFVKRLIALRMKKDVSAREMSLSMGQGKGYVAQVESKKYLPSMTVFFYICDYLNISPKEFFDGDIEFPAVFNELFENLKKLDGEEIVNVNNIIKSIAKYKP